MIDCLLAAWSYLRNEKGIRPFIYTHEWLISDLGENGEKKRKNEKNLSTRLRDYWVYDDMTVHFVFEDEMKTEIIMRSYYIALLQMGFTCIFALAHGRVSAQTRETSTKNPSMVPTNELDTFSHTFSENERYSTGAEDFFSPFESGQPSIRQGFENRPVWVAANTSYRPLTAATPKRFLWQSSVTPFNQILASQRPLQMQLLWGNQKHLKNLKLCSHMVPALEAFLGKTQVKPESLLRVFY